MLGEPFYENCWAQVVKAIPHYIPEVSQTGAIFLLSEYEETHGPDALVAMAGFLAYAQDHSLEDADIKLTLVHDLAGRKDSMMLPRTSDYTQYAKATV